MSTCPACCGGSESVGSLLADVAVAAERFVTARTAWNTYRPFEYQMVKVWVGLNRQAEELAEADRLLRQSLDAVRVAVGPDLGAFAERCKRVDQVGEGAT